MGKQSVFGFFDSMLGQESRVRRLLRFNASGSLHVVSYESWLRFYSSLSSRGVNGGGK